MGWLKSIVGAKYNGNAEVVERVAEAVDHLFRLALKSTSAR